MYKEFFYDGDEGHQRYHFDLNHGYETFDERLQRPLDEGLASICKYLLRKFSTTRPGITLREAVQFADFACFRGTLQKFAATFFEAQRPHKDRGWKFLIVKLQGVFFIQELETDARQEERIQETAYEKLATYWGLKFERYILAENGKIPDSISPVSTIVQTNAIFKLHFNPLPAIPKPITVFYSAEIDGICKVLIIERKPADLNIRCNIQKANYSQIFSKDFLRVFGPKRRY
uniref:Decapping nuclease n=1 Tax=Panagrolaimus sp. ES5 TaxID=591445 RepID=A0AC34G5U5_9BILA